MKCKFDFKGLDALEKNYSDLWQDMFVLAVLDGKEKGTYVEIGAAEPFWMSNTAILEQNYNWTGISFEFRFF